mmetsp:Transcript_9970/g.29428  ORF Transcript_9970/g.29428 Transcript_9970/m.29428 type:complete len:218 (+) Transcript_9970:1256-1909(+)
MSSSCSSRWRTSSVRLLMVSSSLSAACCRSSCSSWSTVCCSWSVSRRSWRSARSASACCTSCWLWRRRARSEPASSVSSFTSSSTSSRSALSSSRSFSSFASVSCRRLSSVSFSRITRLRSRSFCFSASRDSKSCFWRSSFCCSFSVSVSTSSSRLSFSFLASFFSLRSLSTWDCSVSSCSSKAEALACWRFFSACAAPVRGTGWGGWGPPGVRGAA